MTTKNSLFEKLEKKYGRLTFGNFLKAYREADQLTQTQLAKKLNLTVQNLCDIEKSRRIPSPKRAAKIAKKIEMPVISMIQLALRDTLIAEGFEFDVQLTKIA